MNKTILIASGVSVASLAVGGATGYLVATKTLGKKFDERLAKELQDTEGYYKGRIAKLESEVADLQETALAFDEAFDDDQDPDEEESQDDEAIEQEAAAVEIEIEIEGKKALVNYQSFATKPALEDVVTKNVFDTHAKPKKQLPPKDPSTGRFLPKQSESSVDHVQPVIISEEEFLGDDERETVYLRYYVNDGTLVNAHTDFEAVNIALVGEENLTKFVGDGTPLFIYNPQLDMNYEVQLMEESLTNVLGLGEDADADGSAYL